MLSARKADKLGSRAMLYAVLFAIVPGALLCEMGLYYFAPRVLARLAFIPLGNPMRIRLEASEREALVEPLEGELGYRERRTELLALERLADQQIYGERYVAWVCPAAGEIVARDRYSFWHNRMGLIRTRLLSEGDEIVAATRQVPLPLTFPIILPLFGLATGDPSVAIFSAVACLSFVLVATFFSGRRLAHARDASLDHLQDMIHVARKKSPKRRK